MGAVLGLGEAGNALPKLLRSQTVSKAVGSEVLERAQNPLIFMGIGADPSQPLGIEAKFWEGTA